MIVAQPLAIKMEFVTDPREIARGQARHECFERNLA
jgi:hypothetical protein